MHRDDDAGIDRIEEFGDEGEIDRRGTSRGDEDDVGVADRFEFGIGERMSEISEMNEVNALGAEVNDRHLVFGKSFGGFEHVNRLDVDSANGSTLGREFEGAHDFKRGDDLSKVAVIAVVLVADDHEIGGLGDRFVTSRIGRTIRVDDDPKAGGFNQKRGVAVPGDFHRDRSLRDYSLMLNQSS